MYNDERIRRTNEAITSRAFAILSWGLTALLIYRIFFLEQVLSDYVDIFALWLLANAYVAVGTTWGGVQPFGGRPWNLLLVPSIIAIVNVIAVINRGTPTVAEVLFTFVVAFGTAALVLAGFRALYRLWEKRNLS
ncbi:MAG: hypothetical protein R6U92_01145 [Bacillota bacterium]